MAGKDPRIDAYIAKSAAFAKPILEKIRKLVHAACPEAEETMKWGAPFYEYKGIILGSAAFKEHCNLVFWKAKAIGAPTPRVVEGEDTFGRIYSLADLPKDSVMIGYIKKAAALNEAAAAAPKAKAGKSAKPKPKPAAKVELPPEFEKALAKSKKALAAFEAMPPSHRKEYAAWIAGAKRDETRKRRIGQALEMIAEGKSRNWKYERK